MPDQAPEARGDGTRGALRPRPRVDAPLIALPLAGLAVAAVAIAAPYVGPGLKTAASAEVADHVVPGTVIGLVSAGMLVLARRPRALSPTMALAAGALVSLAGLWMVLTHIPLLGQANRGVAPWTGALWHTLSACVALGFGLVWATRAWGSVAEG